jgi:hypothetical protein
VALGDPPNGLLGIVNSMPDMWAQVSRSETEQEMIRQLAQAQMNVAQQGHVNDASRYQQAGAQQAGVWPTPIPPPVMPPNRPATGQALSARAREMFLKRMGGIRAELQIAAEDFLYCHIYGETVYLFYCFAGRDGCVKESIDLFPSDQLITQFRMVLAT